MPEFEINQAANETIGTPETPYLDPDDFAEEVPRTRGREGLPKAFRMRHASHYVEQLMGEAPIQSVRQIPIDQVVGPEVKADVSDLVASIREVGLLQPLLVTSREPSRFELLAGRHRLSAARQAGLSAVPCLLVNADQDADKLKAHTERRPAPEDKKGDSLDAFPSEMAGTADVLRTAFSEISTSMRFIDSLAPIARVNDSGLRATMLVNAISIEAHRATTLAAAASLLTRREPLRLESIDCAAVLQAIRAEIRVEARLKGVTLDWTESVALARTVADGEALSTGWSALIHAILSLAEEGDRLEIKFDAPRVRPALILQVKTHSESPAPAGDRFFDAAWADHPAGRGGAVMLAAALHSARLHGGRLSLATIDDGLSLTFVAPQPLD